ncbi:hypothetical protein Bhyg_09219, partial [Pseudolycoriella hygida]
MDNTEVNIEEASDAKPSFIVGEDMDTIQEAREAVDEFPQSMNKSKYGSASEVTEKRKRL